MLVLTAIAAAVELNEIETAFLAGQAPASVGEAGQRLTRYVNRARVVAPLGTLCRPFGAVAGWSGVAY
ncbi:MAG: hypothetical protein EHM61_18690 [Acidobacteria bacterium]|nr:MAG: hypothetical protein EHM61_18690 [Acidobacteriota bacterium]